MGLGRGWGDTHLQQLLEPKDLGHQHVLLAAQLLPLQPLPLGLVVCLRELAVKPAWGQRRSAPRHGTRNWSPAPCHLHRAERPRPTAAGTECSFEKCC